MPGHSVEEICEKNKFFGRDGAISRTEMATLLLKPGHDTMIRANMRHIYALMKGINYYTRKLRWLMFWYVGHYNLCINKLQAKVDEILSLENILPRLNGNEITILAEALTLLGKKNPQGNYLEIKKQLNSYVRGG